MPSDEPRGGRRDTIAREPHKKIRQWISELIKRIVSSHLFCVAKRLGSHLSLRPSRNASRASTEISETHDVRDLRGRLPLRTGTKFQIPMPPVLRYWPSATSKTNSGMPHRTMQSTNGMRKAPVCRPRISRHELRKGKGWGRENRDEDCDARGMGLAMQRYDDATIASARVSRFVVCRLQVSVMGTVLDSAKKVQKTKEQDESAVVLFS